jgi:uncharacterized protein
MTHAPELLNAHVHYIQTDFNAWCALFANDAVMEQPFGGSAGVDTPLKGIEAIATSVKGFLDALRDFNINVKKIYRIQGEDAVIAEFSATATVIPTGRPFNQDYIAYLRAEKGKIAFYREYYDAARLVAAFTR